MNKKRVKIEFDAIEHKVLLNKDHGVALMILTGILKRSITVYSSPDGVCCIEMDWNELELIKPEHIKILYEHGVFYYSSELNQEDLYLTLV